MTISRTQWLTLHRWIGAALALLLAIQGLTGASLMFRDEIERVIHPELVVGARPARVTVQAMVDTVRATHPDATIASAKFAQEADRAVLFKLKAKHGGTPILTAVSPYSGAVVRDGGLGDWPTEWLFMLHDQLLAGPIGETLIGLEGFGLLFMAITGPLIWWPARGRFRQGFRVRLDGSHDLRWRTLHRAVGAVAAIVLAVSALTGVLLVWKDPLRDVLQTMMTVERKPSPIVVEQDDRAMLPLDTLVRSAQASHGATPLRQLRFSSGGRVVAVYLDGDRTLRPDGTTQVYFNAYSGIELADYVSGTKPAASEFIDWLYPVHVGLWGGIATRILLVLTGLILSGLSMSGVWLWWSRASRRRRTEASRLMTSADA